MSEDAFDFDSAFLDFSEFVRAECVGQMLEQKLEGAQRKNDIILESVLNRCITTPVPNHIHLPQREVLERARVELLSDVVYVALNHTPLARRAKRDFIAAINWSNVSDSGRSWLTASLPPIIARRNVARRPIIFSLSEQRASENEQKNAESWWEYAFEMYLTQTQAEETKETQARTTWNQYLLKYCEAPVPIGVTWGSEKTMTKEAPYYLPMDYVSLVEIGLPAPCGNWTAALLSSGEFQDPDPLPATMMSLRDRWMAMQPVGAIAESACKNVAWTVYMLIRYYAFWGGAAFLSIPYVFGTHAPDHTGILSLCTKRPLLASRVLFWRHLAECMFAPLLAQDALVAESRRAEGEALALRLAYPAHELNSLFRKHYGHIPQVIGRLAPAEMGAEVWSAWRHVESLSWIFYALAKDSVEEILGRPEEYRSALDRLAEPLRQLMRRHSLIPSLIHVANQVRLRELKIATCQIMAGAMDLAKPIGLADDEFAACYLIVAEPIRNLDRSASCGDSGAFLTIADDGNGGIEMVLDHKLTVHEGAPTSLSFECLGALLRAVAPDSGTGIRRQRNGTEYRAVWTTRLGPAFFA